MARDVGGADPERMCAPKVEEYVRSAFPAGCGVKLEVIKDEEALKKGYPLFCAVNRAASGKFLMRWRSLGKLMN